MALQENKIKISQLNELEKNDSELCNNQHYEIENVTNLQSSLALLKGIFISVDDNFKCEFSIDSNGRKITIKNKKYTGFKTLKELKKFENQKCFMVISIAENSFRTTEGKELHYKLIAEVISCNND